MAASANQPEDNQEDSPAASEKVYSSTNGTALNSINNLDNDGGLLPAADNFRGSSALRHDPGISVDWTPDEQSILEDLLVKYAAEPSVIRYANIAMRLKNKTVRDVALRSRWMTKKEDGKRRKEDRSSRKSKDRKEKPVDSSVKPSSRSTAHPKGPSYAPSAIVMDKDDGVSYKAIGGVTGELLEQNTQVFSQISANLTAYQIPENINLLRKARDNILAVMVNLNDMPEIMKQMPPLPVKINEELAKSILHHPPHPHQIKPSSLLSNQFRPKNE